jgi:hypothetical protein
MTQTEPPPPPQPLPLAYDAYRPERDPRMDWIIPWYIAGLFAAGIVQGVVATILYFFSHVETTFGPIDGLLAGALWPVLAMFPATIVLGFCLWTRFKILREVRFASFRTTFLFGIFGGLYPFPFLRVFHPSDGVQSIIIVGELVYIAVFPLVAGFWLCRRSHLRD